jgi:MFS family permease
MWFAAQDNLTDDEVKSALRYVIKDGVASQAMGILTGGAFLVAFAIELGASNFMIGLIAAVGPLTQLIQLPAILLVERVRNRRAIVVLAASLNRVCWLVVALSPFVVGPRLGLVVMLVAMVAASAFGAISGCSWSSWMRDLIPQNILGSFFARRLRLATIVGVVLSLGAAFFLDYWKKAWPDHAIQGYALLFLVGVAIGVLGVIYLAKTPERRMPKGGDRPHIVALLVQPLRDENFRKLIAFMCSWNFAVSLAGPFFMVYMLKRLGLSMSFIIGLSILSQVVNFAFLNIWGRYTDRFSNKSVLAICGPLFIVSILAWTFTTMPEKYFLTIPLLIVIHVATGIASAGIALANGNIGLKLAPEGQATAYLATNAIANSLAAGVAPVLGGKFADFFIGRELAWNLTYRSPTSEFSLPTLNLQQWDFFFALAFIIGVYSLHRLAMIKEVGEVEETIVMSELFAEVTNQVRSLSSVGGLKQMVSFPFAALRDLADHLRNQDSGLHSTTEIGDP